MTSFASLPWLLWAWIASTRLVSPIMEEEDALPDAPEWRCSELIGTRTALCNSVLKAVAHVVEEEVREEVHRLVGERGTWDRGAATRNYLAGGERRRVAGRTANRFENAPTVRDGRRIGRGGGRGQHPHEAGKRLDVRENGCVWASREVEAVLRCRVEETTRSLVAFLGEELVRDPHLDVVGLAGEYEEGLVLRLPSEAGDRAVVGAAVRGASQVRVRVTRNAQPRLQRGVSTHVRQDRRIGDRLDEPNAKDGCGNAEDDVVVSAVAGERGSSWQEVRLSDVAARVAAAGDDEEVPCAAVGRSVRIPLKACFTDGAIPRDEPGQRVFRPIERGDRDQGIRRRAGPADRWL